MAAVTDQQGHEVWNHMPMSIMGGLNQSVATHLCVPDNSVTYLHCHHLCPGDIEPLRSITAHWWQHIPICFTTSQIATENPLWIGHHSAWTKISRPAFKLLIVLSLFGAACQPWLTGCFLYIYHLTICENLNLWVCGCVCFTDGSIVRYRSTYLSMNWFH